MSEDKELQLNIELDDESGSEADVNADDQPEETPEELTEEVSQQGTAETADDHDFVDDLDLTREIDLDDIFGDETRAEDFDDTADLTGMPGLGGKAGLGGKPGLEGKSVEGVTDETLILSPEDLDEAAKAGTDEEDLDKTMVLSMDNIPNPWRDEEDEVLDLFGKEGKTKVYQDEEIPSETMVLDRKALKDELAEEQAGAENPKQNDEWNGQEPVSEEAEEQEGKKRKHYKSHFFLKVALLMIAVVAAVVFALSPVFTIRNIEVEGNKFYTDEQIINMSGAVVGGNLFTDAQKSKIRNNLKENVYFKTIRVKRRIPGTLVIDVEEREELAAVKYGDKYVVIDEEAEVLRIARLDPEVTEITGLTIAKMEIGDKIVVEEKKVFEDTLSTLHTMKEGDLFFKRIEVEDDGITAFIYDMLKVNGNSEQLRAAIEKGTLQKVVNKLMKSNIERGTIILGENDYISFSPAV